MNQFVLTACIAQVKPVRFTPAGLPAIDLELEHESEIEEAGQVRKVKFGMRAIAFGTHAETLAKQAVGSRWQFTGFLASSRIGKYPLLHIQSFQPDSVL